jgi:hypothetical protein
MICLANNLILILVVSNMPISMSGRRKRMADGFLLF